MTDKTSHTSDTRPFDVVVIGAGIHGALVSHQAARAGYRVALVEKEDFGAATSANSLKIIHGGIRYLQHLNFTRMRDSIRSRRAMMRFAPHLVTPLACLMPTGGHGIKGRETMRFAFWLYDRIAADRNRGLPPANRLPNGGALSKEECIAAIPGLENPTINGAALWHDALAVNTERLLLEYVLEARSYGAVTLNYTEAVALEKTGDRVTGLIIYDRRTHKTSTLATRAIVNAAGPWADRWLQDQSGIAAISSGNWARAMNLVVHRPMFDKYAVGLEGARPYNDSDAVIKRGARLFFFVPWRQRFTMIGTDYRQLAAGEDGRPTRDELEKMIADINNIYPAAALTYDDISFYHWGILPCREDPSPQGDDTVQLAKESHVIDHGARDGVHGLLSINGVKYTTAPVVAEKVVAMIQKVVGEAPERPGSYHYQRLPLLDHAVLVNQIGAEHYNAIRSHLRQRYGERWRQVMRVLYAAPEQLSHWVCPDTPLTGAEIVYFIEHEQAVHLTDVVLRRSPMGSASCPSAPALEAAAAIMAKQLSWDDATTEGEIKAVYRLYEPLTRGGHH
jgi:glycerol-3-phosphate dehydrogenase